MSTHPPTGSHHVPVLLDAVLEALSPTPGSTVVDGTLGLGGHAAAILEVLGPDGLLIGMDRDPDMLARASARLDGYGAAFRPVRAPFSLLRDAVLGSGEQFVDGILLDLGLCSAQLDDPARGFSFRESARAEPLDMRMDRTSGETAAELLARVSADELSGILAACDVPRARRTARSILDARPIETVGDLLDVLEGLPRPRRIHHPATLVFQALRLAVNREFDELETALEEGVGLLERGGRLVLLSYHSGEDRRVKSFLGREAKGCVCPPGIPECACGRTPRLRIRERGLRATPEEVARNPRARSARLRAGERL